MSGREQARATTRWIGRLLVPFAVVLATAYASVLLTVRWIDFAALDVRVGHKLLFLERVLAPYSASLRRFDELGDHPLPDGDTWAGSSALTDLAREAPGDALQRPMEIVFDDGAACGAVYSRGWRAILPAFVAAALFADNGHYAILFRGDEVTIHDSLDGWALIERLERSRTGESAGRPERIERADLGWFQELDLRWIPSAR